MSFRTSFCAELCFDPIWHSLQIDFSFVRSHPQVALLLKGFALLEVWSINCPPTPWLKSKMYGHLSPMFSNTAYLPLLDGCHRTSVLSCENYFRAAAAFFTWPAVTSVALEMPLALWCGWASGEMVETHFPGFNSLTTHQMWGICPV